MPLPMRSRDEQPLITIQLAEHRVGLEEASKRRIGGGGKLRGTPANRLQLPEKFLVAPAPSGLNRIGRLHSRGTAGDGLQQGVLAAFILDVALQASLQGADLNRRLRQSGTARAREFSWDRCARETLEVLMKVGKASGN